MFCGTAPGAPHRAEGLTSPFKNTDQVQDHHTPQTDRTSRTPQISLFGSSCSSHLRLSIYLNLPSPPLTPNLTLVYRLRAFRLIGHLLAVKNQNIVSELRLAASCIARCIPLVLSQSSSFYLTVSLSSDWFSLNLARSRLPGSDAAALSQTSRGKLTSCASMALTPQNSRFGTSCSSHPSHLSPLYLSLVVSP